MGCGLLDSSLRGGLLVPGLTEISGTSAAGKTQLCLQLCLTSQLPREQGGLDAGEGVAGLKAGVSGTPMLTVCPHWGSGVMVLGQLAPHVQWLTVRSSFQSGRSLDVHC